MRIACGQNFELLPGIVFADLGQNGPSREAMTSRMCASQAQSVRSESSARGGENLADRPEEGSGGARGPSRIQLARALAPPNNRVSLDRLGWNIDSPLSARATNVIATIR